MFFIVFFILFIILLSCLHLYRVVKDRHYAHFGGPKPLPIIGSILEFGNNSVVIKKDLERLVREYGNVFRVWMGPIRPYICLTTPKDVFSILSSSKEIKKAVDYNNFRKWIGNGLLVSTGEKWRHRRKAINPAFHFTILERTVQVFNTNGNILIKKMFTHVDKKEFNIFPYASLCSLDIMAESALGVQMNAQTEENCIFANAVERGSNIMHVRSYSLWKRSDFLFDLSSDGKELRKCIEIVHERINKIIDDRKKELSIQLNQNSEKGTECDTDRKQRHALLDLLLLMQLKGALWSDDDIREEVRTFMFAGQDSVSTCVAFTIYCLAHHPEIQEKVFQEMRLVIGDDKHVPPTFKQLNSLKYMDRVLKESLRKYPTVPMIGREIISNLELSGKVIPAGTSVIIPIFIMHMNPELFPDPHKFDPDRFLPDRIAEHTNCYFPFSGGLRNCIGQKFAMLEVKSLLTNIFRNFVISPGNDEELVLDLSLVIRPVNGVSIKVSNRIY